MVSGAPLGQASQGYRSNAVAGLSEEQMLSKGLHGLVVHLKRAVRASGADAANAQAGRAQHLAAADRLLVFLMGLADIRTELGSRLIQCYAAIQQLVGGALGGKASESGQALDDALEQARALEQALSATVGDGQDGRPR